MKTNKILLWGGIGLILIIAIGAVSVWAFNDKTITLPFGQPDATSTPIVATTTPATPEQQATTASLNQRILNNTVHITPLEVVGDSRCPMGVYCIQAGAVSVKVKLENDAGSEIVTMVQGSPVSFGNKHVTLMSVAPLKKQGAPIAPSDYRFTFSVAYGMGGDVSTGTLSGTMTIGPICPVERTDNPPCHPTPEMYASNKVTVYSADHKTLVATLTPDADGKFSATLPAGTYYVTMASAPIGLDKVKGVPITVVIKDGGTTPLAIDIDTGIRFMMMTQ